MRWLIDLYLGHLSLSLWDRHCGDTTCLSHLFLLAFDLDLFASMNLVVHAICPRLLAVKTIDYQLIKPCPQIRSLDNEVLSIRNSKIDQVDTMLGLVWKQLIITWSNFVLISEALTIRSFKINQVDTMAICPLWNKSWRWCDDGSFSVFRGWFVLPKEGVSEGVWIGVSESNVKNHFLREQYEIFEETGPVKITGGVMFTDNIIFLLWAVYLIYGYIQHIQLTKNTT